jgi:hypothetical protein
VTLRARWVMLRARWVTLRARWVTLRARWVTLRARWVTLRARWVNAAPVLGQHPRIATVQAALRRCTGGVYCLLYGRGEVAQQARPHALVAIVRCEAPAPPPRFTQYNVDIHCLYCASWLWFTPSARR